MATTTETRYGVARGQKILSGGNGFANVEGAQAELDYYINGMNAVGVTPDVRLVEFDVTVEVSKPRAYKEPEPEAAEIESASGEQGDATTSA